MTRQWMKAAAVRAIKTMAQAGLALVATSQFIEEINPQQLFSVMALAGICSILTSLAGLPEVDPANDPDAYDDDVEPITMEELDELDGDTENTDDIQDDEEEDKE